MKTSKRIRFFSLLVAIITMSCMLVPAIASAKSIESPDTTFTFSDSGIVVSGKTENYKISGTNLTINTSGTYELTGSCSEGSVTISKDLTDVTLILNNLTLTSSTTAPIVTKKGVQFTISAIGVNTLIDAEDPENSNSEGAAIKVKSGGSLLLTGDGTLNVYGNCKNGIKGAATTAIAVESLTLNIEAVNNGLASDGSVTVNSGTININAQNDAIKSEPEVDDLDSAGTITINGGKVTLVSAGDGMQATNDITISGGDFSITAAGGYKAVISEEDSAKGIKSDSLVSITGGTFYLNCADDGIHSDKDIALEGGTYTIYSGDDAVHADYILTVGKQNTSAGPDITIASCVEGFEGAEIYLYGGSGEITASDDGMNAANSDLSNYDFLLAIYGGTWYIDAGGDGVDSNNNIYMCAGTVEAFGAASGADFAIDYDGIFTFEGGTFLGVGISGMEMGTNSGTYVMFGSRGNMNGGPGGANGGPGGNPGRPTDPGNGNTGTGQFTIQKGSEIVIKDTAGNVIYIATGTKSANCVVLASDLLNTGETYTLYIGGTAVATATATGEFSNNTGGNKPAIIKGDVNNSGDVTLRDALEIQRYIAHLIDFTDEQREAADVNSDGKITMKDVLTIQKYVAGIIKEF